jgi:hypothetical protein
MIAELSNALEDAKRKGLTTTRILCTSRVLERLASDANDTEPGSLVFVGPVPFFRGIQVHVDATFENDRLYLMFATPDPILPPLVF